MKFTDLEALFAQSADGDEAQKMAAYMRERFAFFGIPSPLRRLLQKRFFSFSAKMEAIDCDFVFDCFRANER